MSASGPVQVIGIEVVQVVQDLASSVPLFAGKRALARVLLEPGTVPEGRVRGTLTVRNASGAQVSIPSDNIVMLWGSNHPSAQEQRRRVDGTLNFALPGELLVKGRLELEVTGLTRLLGGNQPVTARRVAVDIVDGSDITVRVLGMRYLDAAGEPRAPIPEHVSQAVSFLERTFPVSRVEYSHLTIDAPEGFGVPLVGHRDRGGSDPVWERNINALHVHAMAVRSRDLAAGGDPLCHYYAMIDDPDYRFLAAASDVPASASPETVAAGAAQPLRVGLDHYLLCHELGHVLGRLHPGACAGEKEKDPAYAFSGGRISDDDHGHIGADLAPDGSLRRLMLHEQWYDVMTYCKRKWMSPYSYKKLHQRILEEQSLVGGSGKLTRLLGTYDLRERTAAVLYAVPTSWAGAPTPPDVPLLEAVLAPPGGGAPTRVRVAGKRGEALDLHQKTGAFQCTVASVAEETPVRLEFPDGTPLSPQRHIGWMSRFAPTDLDGYAVQVSRVGGGSSAALAIAPIPEFEAVFLATFTVQVHDGTRWHTVFVGSRLVPRVHLDARMAPGDVPVAVRVSVTDGVHEHLLCNAPQVQ